MFLPTTKEELDTLEWDALDVILISGDSYIDSPYSGVSVIGKILVKHGYRVGIIAQPALDSDIDIHRLGEPLLFWGISGGTVDSMVSNYTATLRKRHSDDFTPGGVNDRRPDRAVITYTNLVKRHFKNTVPIVLGGIEASLRRITHYDYWSDRLRAPILFDSKADFLLYGMAEKSVVELADALRNKQPVSHIRGLCYLSHEVPAGYLELPSFEEVVSDKNAFTQMFETFYHNNDPITAVGLVQKKADRFLVQNPPALNMTTAELDAISSLSYERNVHPYYASQGEVRALETIRFSIPTHRGCYGECNFCAIAVHEGRTVTSRSIESIEEEARNLTTFPGFKGIITDLSGPTANMYGFECAKKLSSGACEDKRCIFPEVCPALRMNHSHQVELLKLVRGIPGVRKVFVGSGIRYDMVIADKKTGKEYLAEIARHHTSGQLKIAPEHTDPAVLKLMGKPSTNSLIQFREQFDLLSQQAGKEQYLSYYFIAAYPGCGESEMRSLSNFSTKELHTTPEQVQVFTPTPSTYASLMYYTEMDPFSGQPLFVEKTLTRKTAQKMILVKPVSTRKGKTTPHGKTNKVKYRQANQNAK